MFTFSVSSVKSQCSCLKTNPLNQVSISRLCKSCTIFVSPNSQSQYTLFLYAPLLQATPDRNWQKLSKC